MTEKSKLRKMMIDRRLNLTQEYCNMAGQKICEKLMAWDVYQAADIIFSYYPCRNEPDIRPLLLDGQKKGKQVAFPKVLGPRQMVFLTVNSLDELKPGYMNIPEPHSPQPADVTTGRILILVPGTAFCTWPEMASGSQTSPVAALECAGRIPGPVGPIGRMGYGGGYYDTFLHRLADDMQKNYTRVTTCGIAYGFQVVSPDVLPIEPHDVLLDRLVYDDIY